MIKRFLYVEDGSVCVDDLEKTLDGETKIIVYRQGSHPPILVEPRETVRQHSEIKLLKEALDIKDELLEAYRKENESLKQSPLRKRIMKGGQMKSILMSIQPKEKINEFIKDLEKERDGFAERNKDVFLLCYFLSLFNDARYYLEEVIKLLEKEKRGKL